MLLGIATDEDSLIRHFTLDPADRLECELRRRPQNKLGVAVQLCTMRDGAALVGYRAATCGCDQLSCGSARYRRALHAFYAHRVQTRFDQSRSLMTYLGLRTASRDDRRAALVAAIVPELGCAARISVDCHRQAPVLISSSVRHDNAPGRLVKDGVGRW